MICVNAVRIHEIRQTVPGIWFSMAHTNTCTIHVVLSTNKCAISPGHTKSVQSMSFGAQAHVQSILCTHKQLYSPCPLNTSKCSIYPGHTRTNKCTVHVILSTSKCTVYPGHTQTSVQSMSLCAQTSVQSILGAHTNKCTVNVLWAQTNVQSILGTIGHTQTSVQSMSLWAPTSVQSIQGTHN